MSNIQLWKASHVDKIPQDVEAIEEIIPYSDETNLTQSQKNRLLGLLMRRPMIWQQSMFGVKLLLN